MTTCNPTKGKFHIIETNINYVTVFLDEFVGEVLVSPNIDQLKIEVIGDCEITNDISLGPEIHLDKIQISGYGSIKLRNIESSVFETRVPTTVGSIKGRHIVITETTVQADPSVSHSNIFLENEIIFSLVDSAITCSGYDYCIKAPLIFFSNSTLDLQANIKTLDCIENPPYYYDCLDIQESDTSLRCQARVTDEETGNPIRFIEVYERDNYGNLVIHTRRQYIGTRPMTTPLDRYEIFRERQGYTNLDLHRRIDKDEDDFEPPEIVRREYDIGIDSLYSMRSTKKVIHDEKSEVDETP